MSFFGVGKERRGPRSGDSREGFGTTGSPSPTPAYLSFFRKKGPRGAPASRTLKCQWRRSSTPSARLSFKNFSSKFYPESLVAYLHLGSVPSPPPYPFPSLQASSLRPRGGRGGALRSGPRGATEGLSGAQCRGRSAEQWETAVVGGVVGGRVAVRFE